jgi:flagellar basal-body rod protein FlgG
MGIRSLYTAATGMNGQLKLVDVIANNLANVNTVGFRRDRLHFADLFYEKLNLVGAPTAGDRVRPVGLQVGNGVRLVATEKEFAPAGLENTGNDYHLAIEGDGNLFFKLRLADGRIGYSRNGTFVPDEDGRIVTPAGHILDPEITVPQEAKKFEVSPDGRVGVLDADNREIQELGQIQLARFVNAAGLEEDGDNLFFETAASGPPTDVVPGEQGNARIRQGFLEQSNVNAITELIRLIQAQRAYEINSNVIRTSDEALQVVNNLKQ